MKKIITTRVHGYIDYIVGIFLILLPWIIGLDPTAPQASVPIVLGVMALVYSLFTKYELGLIRTIPMSVHLKLDMLSGLVLALSPWLFGFSKEVFLPHLIAGLFEVIAALVTSSSSNSSDTIHI